MTSMEHTFRRGAGKAPGALAHGGAKAALGARLHGTRVPHGRKVRTGLEKA